jgi:hypothetical protein
VYRWTILAATAALMVALNSSIFWRFSSSLVAFGFVLGFLVTFDTLRLE